VKDVACGIFRRCAQNVEKASGLRKMIFQAVSQKIRQTEQSGGWMDANFFLIHFDI